MHTLSNPALTDPPPPSDVCLLLRAHAEQRWLSLEVGPVLQQLQQRDSLPEEQLGAALAYLEVLWIEASQRAAETDAVYAQLEASQRAANAAADEAACARQPDADQTLPSSACRYHAAVRAFRAMLARQVAALIAVPRDSTMCEHMHT
jgi:hypothetical protein